MLELLTEIVKNLGKGLGMVLVLMFESIDKVADLVSRIFSHKIEKEKQEEANQNNQNLKDICDNGTLEDLISSKMIFFSLVFSVLFSGCISMGPKIDVNLVKPWEGHYINVQDFYERTRDIQLDEGESFWLFSNKTLYNILKERNVK